MPLFSGPKWDLDTTLRLFILKTGITEVDVQIDLYSDAKELWQSDVNVRQYPFPMRTVGGDPISATQNLGDTYFLINDYRIRPYEGDHELVIDGNIFTDPAGDPIVVPTLGTFTVLVTNTVSNLVDSAVARLDLTQLLPAIFIDADNGDDAGAGTPTDPVATVTAARVLADADNLREYRFRGAISLTEDHTDWTFIGLGAEEANSIALAGYAVDRSKFQSCTLTGSMSGAIEAEQCDLGIISGLEGMFRRCGLTSSTITLASNISIVFDSCFSEVPGTSTPIVDCDGAMSVSFRNYSGGIQLNEIHDGTMVSVDIDPGHLILDSTCDGGTVLVRGHGHLTNNSTPASPGLTLVKRGLLDGMDLVEVRQMIIGDADTSADDLTVTIWDEDGAAGGVKQLEYSISADKRQRRRTL